MSERSEHKKIGLAWDLVDDGALIFEMIIRNLNALSIKSQFFFLVVTRGFSRADNKRVVISFFGLQEWEKIWQSPYTCAHSNSLRKKNESVIEGPLSSLLLSINKVQTFNSIESEIHKGIQGHALCLSMDLFSGKVLNNDAQGDAFDIRNYWHPKPRTSYGGKGCMERRRSNIIRAVQ